MHKPMIQLQGRQGFVCRFLVRPGNMNCLQVGVTSNLFSTKQADDFGIYADWAGSNFCKLELVALETACKASG